MFVLDWKFDFGGMELSADTSRTGIGAASLDEVRSRRASRHDPRNNNLLEIRQTFVLKHVAHLVCFIFLQYR